MRLLILDQFSELGGAQQCLLDLLPAVRARGWQALVGIPGDGPLVARIRESGFETATLDCGPYSYGRKTPADAARFLVQAPRLAHQIRVLAANFAPDLIYVNGPRLLCAAASVELPVIHHVHRILPSRTARELCGRALRRCGGRAIAVCRYVAEPWLQFAGPDRVAVIYNGVRGAREVMSGSRSGAPVIGCIGRIAPEKGQLEFVRAAAAIHRERPDSRFVIYGAAVIATPAYERQVRAAADGLPLEFAGWRSDVQAALSELDLLLVPSGPHEATTRVIPEAFAANTAVIAFPSGGIPEIVENGRTGLLAQSAGEMARLALELIRDGKRRSAIAAAGRESWAERFTLERWQNSVLDYMGSRNIAAAGAGP